MLAVHSQNTIFRFFVVNMIDSKVIISYPYAHKKGKYSHKLSLSKDEHLLHQFVGGFQQFQDFKVNHFMKHPIVYKGHNFEDIISDLYDLDIENMLENTASDKIHVWMKSFDKSAPLESIMLDDANQCYKLYNSGHSLYCRVPLSLENKIIPRVLRELGLGIYSAQTDRYRRGEIETFYSRKGHITEFHTDFQENFTLMLSGRKKWSFLPSSVVHPVRGCSPHFHAASAPDVAEQQLKVSRLCDPAFRPDQATTTLSEADSTVILEVGDILYHPAGVWHRVECLEDSIAINISLIVSSYADLFCTALQQMLLRNPTFRAPVMIADQQAIQPAHEILATMIASLPSLANALRPSTILPSPCYVPPSDNETVNAAADDDDHEEEEEPVRLQTINPDDVDIDSYFTNHFANLSSSDVSMKKRKKNEKANFIDNIMKLELRHNPLATILSEDELSTIGGWESEHIGLSLSKEYKTYIVHIGYGNESYESATRIILIISRDQDDERTSSAITIEKIMNKFIEIISRQVKEMQLFLQQLPNENKNILPLFPISDWIGKLNLTNKKNKINDLEMEYIIKTIFALHRVGVFVT